VIIVVVDRRDALTLTLDSLAVHAGEAAIETLVVANGSGRETLALLERRAGGPAGIRTIATPEVCLSAARNLALAEARAPVALFLNDDNPVLPGALAGHAAFHREHPEREALVFGSIAGDEATRATPFLVWLEDRSRIRWDPDFAGAGEAPAHNFRGGNTSAKVEFIAAAGNFDERLQFGCDDLELGWRLEKMGARAFFDPAIACAHHHPVSLEQLVSRLRNDGRARRQMCEWHPEVELPRRPGARHHLKAAGLHALGATRLGATRVREETWRFLCHEAYREACWGEADPGYPHVRVGGGLARRAFRDEAALAA
jgi:GT2 family glycosyltransferase